MIDKSIVDNNDIIIYDTKDIQNIFKCGKQQAYQIMNIKGFPSIKMNSKLIVEKEALKLWLNSNKGKQILF